MSPFEDGFRVSFEPFVEYLASNRGDSTTNEHWSTQFNLCSACAMNYTIITHLEKSKSEIELLLERIGLENLKIGDQYKHDGPPDELHWQKVPRKTAELIYKHFFLDFIVFGYSTDDVLKL